MKCLYCSVELKQHFGQHFFSLGRSSCWRVVYIRTTNAVHFFVVNHISVPYVLGCGNFDASAPGIPATGHVASNLHWSQATAHAGNARLLSGKQHRRSKQLKFYNASTNCKVRTQSRKFAVVPIVTQIWLTKHLRGACQKCIASPTCLLNVINWKFGDR